MIFFFYKEFRYRFLFSNWIRNMLLFTATVSLHFYIIVKADYIKHSNKLLLFLIYLSIYNCPLISCFLLSWGGVGVALEKETETQWRGLLILSFSFSSSSLSSVHFLRCESRAKRMKVLLCGQSWTVFAVRFLFAIPSLLISIPY